MLRLLTPIDRRIQIKNVFQRHFVMSHSAADCPFSFVCVCVCVRMKLVWLLLFSMPIVFIINLLL